MVKENFDPEMSSADDANEHSRKGGCRSHSKLNQWQIRKYRRAVDENKWYMGERLGRSVTWEEAEYDFLRNEYYGCAPKWRKEFCTVKCGHYSGCDLGKRMVKQ